jgi:hypothetical protein
VPKQAPRGPQGHDQPGQERGHGQGDDDVPAGQRHRDPGGPDRQGILAGGRGDAEHQVGNHRPDPAERAAEMGGERELAKGGWHGHRD